MRAAFLTTSFLLFLCACGDDDAPGTDGGPTRADGGALDAGRLDAGRVDGGTDDAGSVDDAGVSDAGASDAGSSDAGSSDAGSSDAGPRPDAGAMIDAGMRTAVVPGFCPSTATAPGLYRGTLASNLNDIAGPSGCGIGSAPGRDGALRVELAPGQTLGATYRHGGDGILYLLDSCPVVSSCLAGSDGTSSGAETITWTNTGASTNPVYVVLDSDSLDPPQTFELDLVVTGP